MIKDAVSINWTKINVMDRPASEGSLLRVTHSARKLYSSFLFFGVFSLNLLKQRHQIKVSSVIDSATQLIFRYTLKGIGGLLNWQLSKDCVYLTSFQPEVQTPCREWPRIICSRHTDVRLLALFLLQKIAVTQQSKSQKKPQTLNQASDGHSKYLALL